MGMTIDITAGIILVIYTLFLFFTGYLVGRRVKMGRMIDDSVKQKLLDSLAEEPTMVISTAYAYAKNYVNYGEDITKAWTTAVQQASILEQVRQKAWVEAYDSFKKDYEARLKADMAAMLEDLKQDIIAESYGIETDCSDYVVNVADIDMVIQQKINALKENDIGEK